MIKNMSAVHGPFCFMQPSVRNASLLFFIVLLPQFLLLWLTKSFDSLFLIAVSLCASLLSEYVDNVVKKRHTFSDGTTFVEGLIVGMFLPSGYPAVPAFFIIFCALFASKHLFGGLASSWINPAMVTVAAAYGIGSAFFSGFMVSGQSLQIENICTYLFQNGAVAYLPADSSITAWLNKALSPLGIIVPEGYITLFWDSQSIIPAFRFNALTLCASMIFIAAKLSNWIIPVICLAVYGVLVRCFAVMPFTGIMGQGDILVALLTGGMLFTVFFVLPWYGTTPFSIAGQVVYALIAGVFAFLLNGYGTSSSGSIFIVLFANIFSPLIQLIERKIYVLRDAFKLHREVKNAQDNA